MSRIHYRWTRADIERAQEMRAAGATWIAIDKALARPAGSTRQKFMLSSTRPKPVVKKYKPPQGSIRRSWTPDEVLRAKRLRSQGYSYSKIDQMIGRRIGSTQQKLTYVRVKIGPAPSSMRAPDHVIAERDRRKEAIDRRDLTGRLFGDPAPGYSALDRKNCVVLFEPQRPNLSAISDGRRERDPYRW